MYLINKLFMLCDNVFATIIAISFVLFRLLFFRETRKTKFLKIPIPCLNNLILCFQEHNKKFIPKLAIQVRLRVINLDYVDYDIRGVTINLRRFVRRIDGVKKRRLSV